MPERSNSTNPSRFGMPLILGVIAVLQFVIILMLLAMKGDDQSAASRLAIALEKDGYLVARDNAGAIRLAKARMQAEQSALDKAVAEKLANDASIEVKAAQAIVVKVKEAADQAEKNRIQADKVYNETKKVKDMLNLDAAKASSAAAQKAFESANLNVANAVEKHEKAETSVKAAARKAEEDQKQLENAAATLKNGTMSAASPQPGTVDRSSAGNSVDLVSATGPTAMALALTVQGDAKAPANDARAKEPQIVAVWDFDSGKLWEIGKMKPEASEVVVGKSRMIQVDIANLPKDAEIKADLSADMTKVDTFVQPPPEVNNCALCGVDGPLVKRSVKIHQDIVANLYHLVIRHQVTSDIASVRKPIGSPIKLRISK